MRFPKLLILIGYCVFLVGCRTAISNSDTSTEQFVATEAPKLLPKETSDIVSPDTVTSYETPAPEDVLVPESVDYYSYYNDSDFVNIKEYIPGIVIDLKYATEDNISGKVIYNFSDAYLRYGTLKKLSNVQTELEKVGLGLKIWDGFRPVSAQYTLWNAFPNSTYVANPNNGYSSHSRGNTVDVTLVYCDGKEMEMPSGFDDFSHYADRDYSDCSVEAKNNAMLLEELMVKNGFKPYYNEWWHFTDTDSYSVETEFIPN